MQQSPFKQHLQDTFSKVQGVPLPLLGGVWGILALISLACALGWVHLPTPKHTPPPTHPPIVAQVVPTTPPMGGGGDKETLVVTLATPTVTTNGDGFVTLPTPTPESALPIPPLIWGDFGYGIAAHGISMPYYTMDQIKNQLHLTWVKQQVRWDDFSPAPGKMDWSGYDAMVDAANEQGLKVMLSVVGSPKWARSYFDNNPQSAPPDDFALYAQFLRDMVTRYKGRVHAVEVWNEENLDREWDTEQGVNAASYVELLKQAYQTVKQVDPSIIVISGALSPVGASATDPDHPDRVIYMDDFQYFQQMIQAGFLNYADCVGAHHNGINMPPDIAWDEGYNDPAAQFRGPFDNPDHSWSFKSTLWGYRDMIQQAGYNTPLCVTEFGWATAEGFDGYPPGFEFALDNTLAEQASWDVAAFQLMRQWGFVYLAFLWNLDYSYKGGLGPTDPNAPYSILDLQGAPRPAYGAIGAMPKIP